MKKLVPFLPGTLLALLGCSTPAAQTEATAVPLAAPVTTSAPAAKGQVLVILSSRQELPLRGGKTYHTGYYLNELMTPVEALIKAGYEPVFANPQGNAVTADAHSLSADYFGNDTSRYRRILQLRASLTQLQHPRQLAKVVQGGLDGYRGVFFPGGHAPMADLLTDPAVGQALRYFHAQRKPTALICHAPIALLAATADASSFYAALASGKSAQRAAGAWPYQGYRMTIFSTPEEQVAEGQQLGGRLLFYPEAALRAAGGQVQTANAWSSNVVQDRELITGQNPFSDDRLSQLFIAALQAGPAPAPL